MVNATDRDIGANGLVTFSLETTNLPFALVGDVISVVGNLDYEDRILYSVSAEPTTQCSYCIPNFSPAPPVGGDCRRLWPAQHAQRHCNTGGGGH